MIEGAVLPEVGAPVILRRLEIEVGATVVWRANARCGLNFVGFAAVDEWIAGVRQGPREERSQARIDAIQAAIRRGEPLQPDERSTSGMPIDSQSLDSRIAEELAYMQRLLSAIGDELSDDPFVIQRHSRALQNVDAVRQIVGHLGLIVGSQDRAAAVAAVSMEELRARLLRKVIP